MTFHTFLLTAFAATFAVGPLVAQDELRHPLKPFERLIGGKWDAGDSHHVFEWGVGRRVVKTKTFFTIDGREKLVSEGLIYWHPVEGVIKGIVIAIEMPVFLFEMESHFSGDTLVTDLLSHGEQGGRYRERWVFADDDTYTWTLYSKTANDLTRVMGGSYRRVNR